MHALNFYRPHSEGMGKVMFLQASLRPHVGGGGGGRVPPSFLTGGTPSFPIGDTPSFLTGGTPIPGQVQGYPDYKVMSHVRMGVYPCVQRVLATQRAVCLLRSLRRTFLLRFKFINFGNNFMHPLFLFEYYN